MTFVERPDTFRRADWPFYWIVRVSAAYGQVMESVLKPIGLDMPAWRILMALHEEQALSVSDIADFCVIRLNTVTKIIQRMEGERLVERRQSRADGRVTEVRITATGETLRRSAWAEAERIFTTGFAGTDPSEIETMNATLQRTFERLNKLRR